MPNGLPETITQARTAASTATKRVGELSSQSGNIANIVKQKALDAYSANRDVIEPLDKATSEYLASPQVGREKFQDIFNPFTREKLVSQYVGQESLPMLALSSIYGQRAGSIGDLVQSGVGAFEAQTDAADTAAQSARLNYEDLLSEYKITEDLALQREKLGAATKENPLQALINAAISERLSPAATADTGISPQYTPAEGEGAISDDGQWTFSGGQWVSSGTSSDINLNELLGLAEAAGGDFSAASNIFEGLEPKDDANVRKRKVILNQSAPVLQRVLQYALTAPPGMEGALKAKTGKIPGVEGGPAELLQRDTLGFARLIASAFASEVGVATDRDVERWMGLLPKPGDTLNERVDRIDNLVVQVRTEARGLSVDPPLLLSLQDPETGNIYEADNVKEYEDLLNSGYVRY